MKIAIITITDEAQKLAEKLASYLEDDPTVLSLNAFHKDVKKALNLAFREYDCIICIMATGIVVRNICALLNNKLEDPAVLVIDDAGKHVISLLSGHFGCANSMAEKIAHIINAEPVITTATDVHGKMGIDTIASKYFLDIDGKEHIKTINGSLLDNKKPDLYVPERFNFIFNDPLIKNSYNKHNSSDNHLNAVFNGNEINLKPKKLVVGIGARRGISQIKVQKAIENTINKLNLSIERINALSTAEIKHDESGIVKTASKLDIPLEIIPMEKIKDLDSDQCSKSEFVIDKFGVIGISEPVALISAGKDSKLIFRKTAFDGVTIAVAVSSD